MKIAVFTTICGGNVYKNRAEFFTWKDEPYPPGGLLRVMRDRNGHPVAGPHLDELVSWEVFDTSA